MSAKIIVGYRTRPVGDVSGLMPDFKAPSNWKDKDKIASYVGELRDNFLRNAKDAPYTGTFDQVFLVDNHPEKVLQWDHSDDPAKPSVAVRVRNYLVKHYPKGWDEGSYNPKNPPFRVLGFNPRAFLKMLGLECSLPHVDKPLPLRMWYNNAEHRDIIEAVLPKDYDKLLSLATVIKCRRPVGKDDAAKWDKVVGDWTGPHLDPQKDAWLTVELAMQLGLMERA